MAEREEQTGGVRLFALLHQLAHDIVDGGDMVGVDRMAQAEHPGEQRRAEYGGTIGKQGESPGPGQHVGENEAGKQGDEPQVYARVRRSDSPRPPRSLAPPRLALQAICMMKDGVHHISEGSGMASRAIAKKARFGGGLMAIEQSRAVWQAKEISAPLSASLLYMRMRVLLVEPIAMPMRFIAHVDRNDDQSSMTHAAFSDDMLGEMPDFGTGAAQNRDFQAESHGPDAHGASRRRDRDDGAGRWPAVWPRPASRGHKRKPARRRSRPWNRLRLAAGARREVRSRRASDRFW